MSLDLSRCRVPPEGIPPYPLAHFSHQVVGIEAVYKWDDPPTGRIAPGCFGLFDEMGAGKTKQFIDAMIALFVSGEIDRVIVVAPHAVLPVWYDEELGELQKHLWFGLPAVVAQFGSRTKTWDWQSKEAGKRMQWIVTNYELMRRKNWLQELLKYCDKRTALCLDESSAVKNWKSQQTESIREMRKRCRRVVLLNGTPIANSPFDMFAQGNLMDPRILNTPFMTHFKARYAVMGGYMAKTKWGKKIPTQVLRWQNLDDLQRRFAPYVLRRLKKDCLDLPPVLPSVTLTFPLTDSTWNIYKEHRDEMVTWLTGSAVSMSHHAMVKTIRLSQITSGFIGGVQPLEEMLGVEDRPEWMLDFEGEERQTGPIRAFSSEKIDGVTEWMEERLVDDPNLKLIVWCRFIPDVARLLETVRTKYPSHRLGVVAGKPILGEAKKKEREHALRLLDPRTAPPGPVTVAGTYGTGSLGLNFTASHTMVNMSYDYSFWKYDQSAARVDRPGQIHPVSMFDVVATGPKGQKTIDHVIIKARRNKQDIANWTTSAWVSALMEE